MLPDLDSLALFVCAAELHSLTKAADASHIAVAAASRRISLLESRLKTTLFERSRRGVELTPAGHTLLARARTLLREVNQMQADMADHAVGRKGLLRILANTSAMTQFLPANLAAFAHAHPDVRLVVEERWSAEIAQALLAGDADVGIVMEGTPTQGLAVSDYRSDRLAVVFAPGHALARAKTVRFADVLDHDIIALEGGASMMRLLTEQAVKLEKGLRLRVQVRSFEAVCRMVQAGMGIGLLPYDAAMALVQGMQLEVRQLPERWAVRKMLICSNKDRPANPALSRFIEMFGLPESHQP